MNIDELSCFERIDERDGALFYEMPQLVIHVDEDASAALAGTTATHGAASKPL